MFGLTALRAPDRPDRTLVSSGRKAVFRGAKPTKDRCRRRHVRVPSVVLGVFLFLDPAHAAEWRVDSEFSGGSGKIIVTASAEDAADHRGTGQTGRAAMEAEHVSPCLDQDMLSPHRLGRYIDTQQGNHKNIDADRVVLCSDLESISRDVVERFAAAISCRPSLKVVHPGARRSIAEDGMVIYFFAGGAALSDDSRRCLEHFPDGKSGTAVDAVLSMQGDLGQEFGLPGVSPSSRDGVILKGPVFLRKQSYSDRSWRVFMQVAADPLPDAGQNALLNLFGLDYRICSQTDICTRVLSPE